MCSQLSLANLMFYILPNGFRASVQSGDRNINRMFLDRLILYGLMSYDKLNSYNAGGWCIIFLSFTYDNLHTKYHSGVKTLRLYNTNSNDVKAS